MSIGRVGRDHLLSQAFATVPDVERELFRDREAFVTTERFVVDDRAFGVDEISDYGISSKQVRIIRGMALHDLSRYLIFGLGVLLVNVIQLDKLTGLGGWVIYVAAILLGIPLWLLTNRFMPTRETWLLIATNRMGDRLQYVAGSHERAKRALDALEMALRFYRLRDLEVSSPQ